MTKFQSILVKLRLSLICIEQIILDKSNVIFVVWLIMLINHILLIFTLFLYLKQMMNIFDTGTHAYRGKLNTIGINNYLYILYQISILLINKRIFY